MDKRLIAAGLKEAADLIEQAGWWNGKDPQGDTHCLVTALDFVTGSSGGRDLDALIDAMQDHVGRSSLMSWNDSYDRTNVEVIAALRGAAQAQLKGESTNV